MSHEAPRGSTARRPGVVVTSPDCLGNDHHLFHRDLERVVLPTPNDAVDVLPASFIRRRSCGETSSRVDTSALSAERRSTTSTESADGIRPR